MELAEYKREVHIELECLVYKKYHVVKKLRDKLV